LAKVKSIHRVDAVENSPGVHQELGEGIRHLPGWRKGVCQKKTETRWKIVRDSRKTCRETGAMKLQPDDGPKSSLGIESGSDDAVGFRREFARRFAEGIEKLTGNTSEDHREKTYRKYARGYRIGGS
ncbi:hypothetical protein GW17_00053456, partial [Ensete ventricosum]